MSPYLFVLIALFSFAAMGIVHKFGDRLRCSPLAIALYAMVAAALLSGLHASATSTFRIHPLPPRILLIAIPFGFSTALSLWLFQEGLRFGRIATSWLLINLSAAVPTVLSAVVYREPLDRKKALVLCLIVCSLLLLWWDRRTGNEPKSAGAV